MMEIQGYRVEFEDGSVEMYPVEDFPDRPPPFGETVIALVASVDAGYEAAKAEGWRKRSRPRGDA